MEDHIRSKVTTFAQLWIVSMVLFIVMSICAVIAAMNEHVSLMGLAVIGSCLMLIIQLCQLIAAFIVRRWWHVAGGLLAISISVFVMICCIVALAAGQYRPPVIYDNTETSDSTEIMTPDSISTNEE